MDRWTNGRWDRRRDRQTDEQTNESDFIGRCPTNIEHPIKQTVESQKGCYKKTKHTKFSEKLTFPTT